MSTENNFKIGIIPTCNYGLENENSKCYDMREKVGNKMLDYRLTKIKCQLKSNEGIYGIQFFYRNVNTAKEEALINVKSNETNLIEQEMNFAFEEANDLRVWLSDEYKLIGFEISTNKNKSQKFGYGNDDQLIICPDFENKDQTIVGFGVHASDDMGVTSIYGYYLNKRTYSYLMYKGVFSLRNKIKEAEYKKKMDGKIQTMEEKNQILYRICCLPDNQFFNIIKFALS